MGYTYSNVQKYQQNTVFTMFREDIVRAILDYCHKHPEPHYTHKNYLHMIEYNYNVAEMQNLEKLQPVQYFLRNVELFL